MSPAWIINMWEEKTLVSVCNLRLGSHEELQFAATRCKTPCSQYPEALLPQGRALAGAVSRSLTAKELVGGGKG